MYLFYTPKSAINKPFGFVEDFFFINNSEIQKDRDSSVDNNSISTTTTTNNNKDNNRANKNKKNPTTGTVCRSNDNASSRKHFTILTVARAISTEPHKYQ